MNSDMGTHCRIREARCFMLFRILRREGDCSGRVWERRSDRSTWWVMVVCLAFSIRTQKSSNDLKVTLPEEKVKTSRAMEYFWNKSLPRLTSLFMTARLQVHNMQSWVSGMSSSSRMTLRASLATPRTMCLKERIASNGLKSEEFRIKDCAEI